MKKIFMALSTLFAVSFASNGTSGYTEAIVEDMDLLITPSPQRASTPLTSSPDYDGTLELPHNPYSGKIEQFKFNDEKPRLEKGLNHQYGFDRPYEECFNNNNPPKNCFIHYTLPSDYEFKHPKVIGLIKNGPSVKKRI